jgi:hypothetical protein
MNTQTPTPTDPAAASDSAQLRADLVGLSREAGFLPARDWDVWCDAVRLRLRALRQQLKGPASAHAGLVRSHRSLLVRLDALAMDAALHVEPPLWTGALRELLADIALYEEREDELPLQPGARD